MDEFEVKKKLAEAMWGGFYRCPNTQRIIECLPGDDKAICPCGRRNPNVLTEYPGVHIVRFLEKVTSDAYVQQQLGRDK